MESTCTCTCKRWIQFSGSAYTGFLKGLDDEILEIPGLFFVHEAEKDIKILIINNPQMYWEKGVEKYNYRCSSPTPPPQITCSLDLSTEAIDSSISSKWVSLSQQRGDAGS